MSYSKDVVRVNTRISKTLNDWLDRRSKETGYSKSTLIMLALENYYQQTEVIEKMGDMQSIYQELKDIKKQIKKLES